MLTESPQVPTNKRAYPAYLIDLFSRKFQKKGEEVPDASADRETQEEEEEEEEEDVDDDDDYDDESDADYGSDCSVSSDDTPDGVRRSRERENLVVTDFINQVQENRFPVFGWPPPSKCPTYKYGMTVPYVGEFDFETESGEHYDTAKKFLKQVRTSWGYDVDCTPPAWLRSPFLPINLKSKLHKKRHCRDLDAFPKYALEKINAQAKVTMGKSFELVKIEKAVRTHTMMLLLTLTIREKESGAEKAIRAAVSKPPGWGLTLFECKLIPPLSSSTTSSS